MAINLWAVSILICRILLYASVASAIGGMFSSILLARHSGATTAISHYIQWGCACGIVATVSGFCIQVGSFADQGAIGILDLNIMSILLQASVGTAVVLQLAGFLLIGAAICWSLKIQQRTSQQNSNAARWTMAVIGAVSLLLSFSQVGHLAEGSLIGKIAISLHLLAMSLWLGSLYPLWLVSRDSDLTAIQESMRRFGQLAVIIISVLITCGILMGVLLLKNINSLLLTPYGNGLLVKLGLVASLLLLAASNKWFIVPRLLQVGFAPRLSRAIAIEMLVGGLILLITGIITIIIGIAA